MTHETNEQGQRLYRCMKCLDMGWTHPVVDGKPDYGAVNRCSCRAVIEKQRPTRTEQRKFKQGKNQ